MVTENKYTEDTVDSAWLSQPMEYMRIWLGFLYGTWSTCNNLTIGKA